MIITVLLATLDTFCMYPLRVLFADEKAPFMPVTSNMVGSMVYAFSNSSVTQLSD
jgi:hypothetical protein